MIGFFISSSLGSKTRQIVRDLFGIWAALRLGLDRGFGMGIGAGGWGLG